MRIDKVEGVYNGQREYFAPLTIFDAVKVSESSDETLSDVVNELRGNRDTFSATNTGGHAIIMQWYDNNVANEDRVGKFITIDAATGKIRVATIGDFVYGVVVDDAAYIEKCEDISGDPSKAYICIGGIAKVVCKSEYSDSDLRSGKRVILSEAGNARRTQKNYGYPVLSIIDKDHLEILYLPNMDALVSVIDKLEDLYDRISSDILISVEDDQIMIGHEIK